MGKDLQGVGHNISAATIIQLRVSNQMLTEDNYLEHTIDSLQNQNHLIQCYLFSLTSS